MAANLPWAALFSLGVASGAILASYLMERKTTTKSKKKRVGIIGALPEEIAKIKEGLKNSQTHKHGTFEYYTGIFAGKEVVVAPSRVGVIYASSVATTMIEEYNAHTLIFTGVAGGIKVGSKVGDIIVARDLINYEMNCKNFILAWDLDYRHKLGEYPFMNGLREFTCDKKLIQLAMEAPLGENKARRILGRVVTGSEFHSTFRKQELSPIWEELDNPDAVEMEGVAVAQIAHAYSVPVLVLRTVSDTIEGDSSSDFHAFAKGVAELLTPIVAYVVENL